MIDWTKRHVGLVAIMAALSALCAGGAAAATTPIQQAQVAPGADELAAYRGSHAAAARGDGAAIARLVAAGADVQARDGRGRTPLMIAAHRGRHAAARALIAAGADVNLFDRDRYDALTIAAVADDVAMVRLLIAAGADAALVTSPYQGTALIAAAHLGHVEVVQALIAAKAPLDHVNNLAWTALIEAIVLGDGGSRHVAIVQALLAAGANPNLADGNGVRPLTLAHRAGHDAIADALTRAGARP